MTKWKYSNVPSGSLLPYPRKPNSSFMGTTATWALWIQISGSKMSLRAALEKIRHPHHFGYYWRDHGHLIPISHRSKWTSSSSNLMSNTSRLATYIFGELESPDAS